MRFSVRLGVTSARLCAQRPLTYPRHPHLCSLRPLRRQRQGVWSLMARTAIRKDAEFLAAIADEVSPALESVDFAGLLEQLVAWAERQKPPLERRTNASKTTISYAIPENDVLVWRVAPRMKDGAKVEVLPRDSALLPARARQAMAKLLEVL